VRPYATRYVDLQPAAQHGTLELRFSGTGDARLYNGAPHSGRAQWWGNAADQMESTLTRQFDLTGVDHATLTFSAWYDVERDYDYAGVAVSSDNGCTWHTLPGQHTTDADPLGQNLGNGFTGHSGGADIPVWVDESMDLTPYVGEKVLVRFFNITDQSYHGSGIAIDDVAIPEIGFADDAESDHGWDANGFLRSVNAATLDWAVQVVTYAASGQQVLQVPVRRAPAAPGSDATTVSGALSIPQFGTNVTRVDVAISPLIPVTLVPADFTLDASVH
jgi:hypothetical protein